jgi:hypothetical protein
MLTVCYCYYYYFIENFFLSLYLSPIGHRLYIVITGEILDGKFQNDRQNIIIENTNVNNLL